jgi:PST family polysaccharide transporter
MYMGVHSSCVKQTSILRGHWLRYIFGQAERGDILSSGHLTEELKRRTVRAGAMTICAQFAKLVLYTASTVILARLLSPEDFGLVAMVTAVTGFLGVFKDAGLSAATVQRNEVTHDQVSTLFWINVAVGGFLALAAIILAPALAVVYREPRVVGIALALSPIFVFAAATAQHEALLRRRMDFRALAIIDVCSMLVGVLVGVGMAKTGFGYWSLVGMPAATAVTNIVAAWTAMPWRPGFPRRGCGVRSMVRFGGYMTSVNLVNYLFRSADKILIGRRWSAGPLGLYQRAYGLLLMPIDLVNSPISGVAMAALCRVQTDLERLGRYFVAGYSIVASTIMPIIFSSAVFSDDIILFLLGPKWSASIDIFRFLTPAALIGALLNPFGWLWVATGRVDRQFKCGCVWSTLVVLGFWLGLGHGPKGVALGYSLMSCLLAVPLCMYAIHETPVRLRDIAGAIQWPLIAAVLASVLSLAFKFMLPPWIPVAVRAVSGCLLLVGTYAFILLVLMKQWGFYRDLVQQLMKVRSNEGAKSVGT